MIAGLTVQVMDHCLPLQEVPAPYLVFEYLYRDSSNYKAFGELWLAGSISGESHTALAGSLESGEFFVAEQLGVPLLYDELFKESGGRTRADHAWHTFTGFRSEFNLPPDVTIWGEAVDLLSAIVSVNGDWRPQLSANYWQ